MIKVKNIYYMLAYAFQILNEAGYEKAAAEDFDNINDLMASILSIGITSQVKRGLNRDYEVQTESLSCLRGKIDISASVKQQTMVMRKMVCNFDIFSENTLMNQILKTTSMLLIRSGDVHNARRRELKKLMLYFNNVDLINPLAINWTSLKYHRNNSTYKMLINICYLVIKGLLLTTETGTLKLGKYIDDQYMHRLYEKFVLEYYRKHYPRLKANPSFIDWNVDNGESDFLPQMKSDITLTYGGKTMIIDTKYYGRTMQKNSLYNKSSLISANLYQIFTYVKNRDKNNSGNVSGVLLYAKTDEEITPDNDYSIGGNRISVKTLDLNADWAEIKEQLNAIVEPFFQQTFP